MTRRAALLAELARLASAQAAVLSELAALEGGAERPAKPRRRRLVEPPPALPVSADPKVVQMADEKAARALRRLGY